MMDRIADGRPPRAVYEELLRENAETAEGVELVYDPKNAYWHLFVRYDAPSE